MPRIVKVSAATPAHLLTLEQVKLHCRAQHNTEDELFNAWIASAEAYAEGYTARCLLTTQYQWIGEEFPEDELDLLVSPVQSIQSVSYYDENGDVQTLAEEDYELDGAEEVSVLVPAAGTSWPATLPGKRNAVTIVFTAGYRATQDGSGIPVIPQQFAQAIKLMIAQWYQHREEVIAGQALTPPIASQLLLDQVTSTRYV